MLVSMNNLAPVWPEDWGRVDWSQFGAAMVGVLWAYHGWMNVAPVAEEVKDPNRNIPLALVVGTLTIMALYVAANFAYYLVVPRQDMIMLGDRIVASEFGLRLLGPIGLLLVSGAIMMSVFGALNGNLLVGPRLLFAMGRDRLAPSWLSHVHSSWGTPVPATLVLASWSIFLVVGASMLVHYRLPVWEVELFANAAPVVIDLNLRPGANLFDVLTDYAIFGATAFETMAVAALFVLRPRSRDIDVPYRCPLYPLLPLVYVLAMGAVLANMFVTRQTEAFIAVGFIAVGAVFYAVVFAGRRLG
jgi:amino acid transporter